VLRPPGPALRPNRFVIGFLPRASEFTQTDAAGSVRYSAKIKQMDLRPLAQFAMPVQSSIAGARMRRDMLSLQRVLFCRGKKCPLANAENIQAVWWWARDGLCRLLCIIEGRRHANSISNSDARRF